MAFNGRRVLSSEKILHTGQNQQLTFDFNLLSGALHVSEQDKVKIKLCKLLKLSAVTCSVYKCFSPFLLFHSSMDGNGWEVLFNQ